MGMIKIEMAGSFPTRTFTTSAEAGGHVMALKRGIEFLVAHLGYAVQEDAELTVKGAAPPQAPLGRDTQIPTETETAAQEPSSGRSESHQLGREKGDQ